MLQGLADHHPHPEVGLVAGVLGGQGREAEGRDVHDDHPGGGFAYCPAPAFQGEAELREPLGERCPQLHQGFRPKPAVGGQAMAHLIAAHGRGQDGVIAARGQGLGRLRGQVAQGHQQVGQRLGVGVRYARRVFAQGVQGGDGATGQIEVAGHQGLQRAISGLGGLERVQVGPGVDGRRQGHRRVDQEAPPALAAETLLQLGRIDPAQAQVGEVAQDADREGHIEGFQDGTVAQRGHAGRPAIAFIVGGVESLQVGAGQDRGQGSGLGRGGPGLGPGRAALHVLVERLHVAAVVVPVRPFQLGAPGGGDAGLERGRQWRSGGRGQEGRHEQGDGEGIGCKHEVLFSMGSQEALRPGHPRG